MVYDYVFDKNKCAWKPWMETVKVRHGDAWGLPTRLQLQGLAMLRTSLGRT